MTNGAEARAFGPHDGRSAKTVATLCATTGLLLSSLFAGSLLGAPTRVAGQEPNGVTALASRLQQQVAGALDGSSGRLVIRPRMELPAEAPRPWTLAADLLAPTRSALSRENRWEVVHVALFRGDGEDAAVRASRLGYDVLVDLHVRLVGARLYVTGFAYGTRPAILAARFEAAQALDVPLRHYVGFPSRVTEEAVTARDAEMPSRGYLAVALSDLDQDGRAEMIGVRAEEAQVFRIMAAPPGGLLLEEVGRARWPAVPRASSRPPRELATAVATEGAVVTRLGDFAQPLRVRLSAGRVVVERADGPCRAEQFPVSGGCTELVAGRDFFEREITRGDSTTHQAAASFYAYAARSLRTRSDEVTTFEAAVTRRGRLTLRSHRETDRDAEREAGSQTSALGYGTALAMTDLDLDGSAELLTSHAAPAGRGDQLSILRAQPHGALHVVWRSEPISGSVWTAAAGDVDGDGLDEMVAIEEPADPEGTARLWVVP